MEPTSGSRPGTDTSVTKAGGSVQIKDVDKSEKTFLAPNGATYNSTSECPALVTASSDLTTSRHRGGTPPMPYGSVPDKSTPEKQDMDSSIDKEDELLLASQQVKSYSRRWYVLIVFSIGAMMQSALWNTWGPIAQSAKQSFNWSNSQIGMFANWGNIVYVIAILPVSYLMDVKGLRLAMVVCTALCAAGAAIRCVTADLTYVTWTMNIGAILNGVGGTALFAGAPLVSVTWFPLDQRNTATAIASVFPYLGIALSFVLGPLFVPEPVRGGNSSHANYSALFNSDKWVNLTSAVDVTYMQSAIMKLMYLEAGIMGLLLLMVLVYFPARPPTPPTFAASTTRSSYGEGLRKLLKNWSLWLVLAAYSMPVGVFGAWGAVLDVNLHPVGVSQDTAGWIGFYSTLAGCVSSVALSRIADQFQRKLKFFILFLLLGAVIAVTWIILLCLQYIPFNKASLYVSAILSGFFINGTVPLFFELGCEAAYPVAEGLTGGMLTLANNVTGILFLLILLIPDIGESWMNWVLLGSTAAAVPIMCLFKEDYSRTNLDLDFEVPGAE